MEAMMVLNKSIEVEIKKASGKYRIYPICELGQLLHSMAGCKAKSFDEKTVRDMMEKGVRLVEYGNRMDMVIRETLLTPDLKYYGYRGQQWINTTNLIGWKVNTDERWPIGWQMVELY